MFIARALHPPPLLHAEYCSRGSLYDVLKPALGDPDLAGQLSWGVRLQMALDAAVVSMGRSAGWLHCLLACGPVAATARITEAVGS